MIAASTRGKDIWFPARCRFMPFSISSNYPLCVTLGLSPLQKTGARKR